VLPCVTAVGRGRVLCGSLAVCSLWIVNQVLVRLWMRGTSRWVSAALFSFGGRCGSGLAGEVRDGLARVV